MFFGENRTVPCFEFPCAKVSIGNLDVDIFLSTDFQLFAVHLRTKLELNIDTCKNILFE